METIGATAAANLIGGSMGAGIKLVAGIIMWWIKSKREDRAERLLHSGKKVDWLQQLRPDPKDDYVRHTRRILAWGVCFTFCFICILWSIFPGYPVFGPGGDSTTTTNLFLWSHKVTTNMGNWWTTGAIVWQLTPFVSMILMTYFTPDISKI